MTTFDRREDAFERAFVHDEETHFRARARRNKLVGLWAAAKLGLNGDKAEDYAREMIRIDVDEVGDTQVFARLRRDFDQARVQMSDHQLQRTLNHIYAEALAQIRDGL